MLIKKSNIIIFAVALALSAFILWLWYALNFNAIDAPLDLVLSVVWWAVIAVAIIVIVKMEKTRQERVRTVYVSDQATFNSEKGIMSFEESKPLPEVLSSIISNLKYDFTRVDFPEKDSFQVKYFVRTKNFKDEKSEQDEAPDGAPVQQSNQAEQKVWSGEVVVVDTQEEKPFESAEELASILAALNRKVAA